MSRGFKLILWIAGILLALVALAALAIKVLLPKEKIKALIIEKANTILHRQVRLEDLSVGLFSGLTVQKFQLSEVPDFEHGTFISSERIILKPQLLPLLSKKLFVDVVALTQPDITIIRNQDGHTYNFSDLSSASTNSSDSSSANSTTPSPFVFLISKISVENGRIQFVDHSPAVLSTVIGDLNLGLRNVTMAGPMGVNVSFTAQTQGIKAQIAAVSSISILLGTAHIESLTVSNEKSKLTASGDVKGLQSDPTFDLKWDLKDFNPQVLAPMKVLPPAVKISGTIAGHGSIQGGTSRGSLTANVDGTNCDIRYGTATFHKQPGVDLILNATGRYRQPLALDLSELKLQLAQLQLSGPVTYSNGAYNLHMQSNDFPLETITPLLPGLDGVVLKGPATVVVDAKGGASAPAIQGTATLKNVSASSSGATVSGIQSKINFTADDTNGTLTAPQVQHDYFSGANLKLQWNLKSVVDMAKMNGTATLDLGGGTIKNIQKLVGDNKIAKMFLTPVLSLQKSLSFAKNALKLPSVDPLIYKSLAGKYQFQKGVMTINAFDMVAELFKANMKGTIGLVGAQAINASSEVTLPTIADVTPVVTMAIKGTVDNPDVSVNKADTGKQILNAITNRLNKGGSNESPEKQIEGLLKGLFKK